MKIHSPMVHILISVITVLLVVAFFASAILKYKQDANQSVMAAEMATAKERIAHQENHFHAVLDGRLQQLDSLAAYFSTDMEGEQAQRLIQFAVQTKEFDQLILTDETGSGYTSEGTVIQMGENDAFLQIVAGEPTVVDLLSTPEKEEDSYSLIVMVPIVKEGAMIGTLSSTDKTETLRELFFSEWEREDGSIYVFNAEGQLLMSHGMHTGEQRDGDVFSLFKQASFLGDASLEGIKEALEAGKTGVVPCDLGDGTVYSIAYAPLEVNDWYILCAMPQNDIDQNDAFMEGDAFQLGLKLTIGFLLILSYVIWYAWSKNCQIREEKMCLEWREKRNRMLEENSREAFFEYHVTDRTLETTEEFRHLFGRDCVLEEAFHTIHPEDQEQCQTLWRNAMEGTDTVYMAKVRIWQEDSGQYLWCRIRIKALPDPAGAPSWIIGKITDISGEK